MPIEGLEQTTDNGNAQGQTGDATQTPPVNTSDATAQNTGANQNAGTGTQTPTTEAPETDKKFTQADVDRIVQNRLKSAVKAELKKLTSEGGDTPNVEDLQRQLSERDAKLRTYESRQSVSDYLTDARHKLNVKPENVRPIEELVIPRLEYGDDGKPTNVKEAIEEVKSIAPVLFANTPPSINANEGRNGAVVGGNDMNAFIRRSAGFGN